MELRSARAWSRSPMASSRSLRSASISSNSIWRVGSDTGGEASCGADVEASRGGLLLMSMSIGVRTSGRGDSGDSGSSLRFVRFVEGRTIF